MSRRNASGLLASTASAMIFADASALWLRVVADANCMMASVPGLAIASSSVRVFTSAALSGPGTVVPARPLATPGPLGGTTTARAAAPGSVISIAIASLPVPECC